MTPPDRIRVRLGRRVEISGEGRGVAWAVVAVLIVGMLGVLLPLLR